MATVYEWDSPRKKKEVLDAMLSLTDRNKRTDPFALTYKNSSDGETRFTILHDPFMKKGIGYMPPNIGGSITDTPNGCKIVAKVHTVMFLIGNVLRILLILLLYITSIMFAISGIDLSILFVAVELSFAIGATFWYLHTHTKYGNLKVHLEIINAASGVDSRTRLT